MNRNINRIKQNQLKALTKLVIQDQSTLNFISVYLCIIGHKSLNKLV